MYEHKIIKANDKAIWILQEEWRGLCTIYEDKMYFKKKVTQTKNTISWKETEQRKEFIEFYRKNITNKWSYSEPLSMKYI